MTNLSIIRGGAEHIEAVVAHRRGMFHDMGYQDETALDLMAERFRPWVLDRIQSGSYLPWFAVDESDDSKTILAGAGLWLMDWPPHMIGSGARRGNIVNVYTAPPFRRHGLARQLMETILAWCRENGVDTIVLHASKEGRPLYDSLGFAASNEMRLSL
jgi:GNAT superfamily N-acetyltransferase